MVRYWCAWCGATEERETADERVPCWRCVREFVRIFRYYPRALMVPLDPGEAPGIPAGARRQFEFRDARSGKVIAKTKRIPPPNGKTRRMPPPKVWSRATGTDGS